MKIEEAIQFFGHSNESKELDAYLTSLGFSDRPTFDENPMEWVSKNQEGFTFIFDEKHGYEETWGQPKEDGEMIFCTIRVYGKGNSDDFAEYKGELPNGLTFNSTLADAIKKLGKPDSSRESFSKQMVCNWNNLQKFSLSIVFLTDDQGIAFLNVKPAAA